MRDSILDLLCAVVLSGALFVLIMHGLDVLVR
jgi:hypothetical protein